MSEERITLWRPAGAKLNSWDVAGPGQAARMREKPEVYEVREALLLPLEGVTVQMDNEAAIALDEMAQLFISDVERLDFSLDKGRSHHSRVVEAAKRGIAAIRAALHGDSIKEGGK